VDSLLSAKRVREEILDAIRKLVAFPQRGHIRSDLTSRPLRFLIVRDFPIAYAPDEKPIIVIAVVHCRRSLRVLAAILRGRK
jgi:plasmid stabilization system protein ParE